jgi:Cft2 family RNA processing exonuclease
MQLTFLGGAAEVGASSTLLEVGGHRLLIDGGIRPAAREGQPRLPDLAPLDAAPPEAIVITHAHIDHTGALPLIASLFPHIPIYATESTRVLTEILLRDSVRIMETEHCRPDGETPLYSDEQVDRFLARITAVNFQQPFSPIPAATALTLRFLPAGHILGAAMLLLDTPEGRLLHTGDISVTDQRTIKGLDPAGLPQVDLLLCEGTYGNRSHTNRKEEERRLAETVQATLARGGRVLCPAFAVGRAQEVVLILKAYRASGVVSPVPLYLDGMVRAVCAAYQAQAHDLHPSLQRALANSRRPLFADPDLHIFAVRSQEREALTRQPTPMVVISSSGMLTGGASPLYAAEMATREQDCIVFSGYQDEESPGAALLKARQGDRLQLGEQVLALACQVERYNLSGHADAEQLVHVVAKVNPRQLVLVHGASVALEALASRFPKIPVEIPHNGSILSATFAPATHPVPHAAVPSSDRQAPDEQHPAQPIHPPTIHDLWQVASRRGPSRPWTAVELGQHYFGGAYRPALRTQVEQVLAEASAYFKIGRVGAQPTYLPRAESETHHLFPVSQLPPGEVVLVQGHNAAPQLALLLSAPREGTASLVAEQWKAGTRPMNLIQLIPGVRRQEWLALPADEARQQLKDWRLRLDELWVDLFAWWDRCRGTTSSFDDLANGLATEEERLAWGLELLFHGRELFLHEGTTWTPLPEQTVCENAGYGHHLELLRAGKGTPVVALDKRGTLTGRSTWRTFEVRWEEGEEETGRIRANHIAFL